MIKRKFYLFFGIIHGKKKVMQELDQFIEQQKKVQDEMVKYISQANMITLAKMNITKVQKQIIYLIAEQLNKITTYSPYYTVSVSMQPILKGSKNHSELRKAAKGLIRKVIEINYQDIYKAYPIIMEIQNKKGSGVYTFMLNNDIAALFINLWDKAKEIGGITKLNLREALTLKTKYGQKFYELFSQFKNEGLKTYEIEQIRILTDTTNKYKNTGQFKKYVVDSALADINKNTSMKVYLAGQVKAKKGKTVTGYRFNVVYNDKAAIKNPGLFKTLTQIYNVIPRNAEIICNSLDSLQADRFLLEVKKAVFGKYVNGKLQGYSNVYNVENPGGLAYQIFKDHFK